jgi:hypothetical protein
VSRKLENTLPSNSTSDRVGCVRRLTSGEDFVCEHLLCVDDGNYTFAYETIEGTLPVRGYVAGVRLHRVTHGNRTFVKWWAISKYGCRS